MLKTQSPSWMRFLERKLSWLSIPNLALILITLQALGSLFVLMDPIWINRLALVPSNVLEGEYWRLVTFLALPLSMSPIWIIFALWSLYFIVTSIEREWGAFKTTFYVLISYLLMIVFSFIFQYPITHISSFISTLFLAAAALFPDMEILFFFVIPAKMKWLAWLTLLLILFNFITGEWVERFYLLAIYSNYFVFFGPAHFYHFKQMRRKWEFQSKLKR